jgi:hypothetical protein
LNPQPEPRRPHLQRVPPNDPTLEAHLLGAALLNPTAAATVAALQPGTWYKPANQRIAATIAELHNTGQPCDTGTVCAHLRQLGELDNVGGYVAVTNLAAETPTTRSHPNWADRLERLANQRQILHVASEVVEAVYRGTTTTGLLTTMVDTAHQLDHIGPSSWEPVNLAATLAGEGPDTTPTVGERTDGINLLYPGKIHAVNAEPEAGKTWLCVHIAAQQLGRGSHVIYIDFEADAADITNRLLNLGATPQTVLNQFHYIRPDEPASPATTARITALCDTVQPTLVVIDGVTEIMANAGWSINDNDDIARFYATLPRPVAACGPAVILIDHLVKDRENQGRWGIGGQHKLAGIDGAVYKLEQVTPFAPNKPGTSKLIVAKDRHGQVRRHATTGTQQTVATVRFDTTNEGMNIRLEPPGQGDRQPFIPTRQMQRVSEALQASPTRMLSKRAIRAAVHGDNNVIDLAVNHLVGTGHARTVRGGIEHVRPYTEPQTPPDTDDTKDNDDIF